jgi:hypothetical protein
MKSFSDHEKDKFLDDAFNYIAKYFEGSQEELKKRNPDVELDLSGLIAKAFNASVYINGAVKTECMIFYGSGFGMSKSMSYSHTISSSRNSFNESLSVAQDGYNLFLKPIGMSMMMSGRERKDSLTFEGAVEYYWEMFIQKLQGN